MRVHHIGYLVKNLKKAQSSFESLGYQRISETVYDQIRDVNICFLKKDNYTVELVCPGSENSVVYGLMKKYKNSPYHICYETANLEEELKKLESSGFLRIDAPCTAPAIEGRKVCFLQSANAGMIEILGEK